MPVTAVYDANVLYGNTLRDLLIRISMAGLVRAKWTNQILDEMQRNLTAKRPDIARDKFQTLRRLMNAAVRDPPPSMINRVDAGAQVIRLRVKRQARALARSVAWPHALTPPAS